jgi:hypothetical protein
MERGAGGRIIAWESRTSLPRRRLIGCVPKAMHRIEISQGDLWKWCKIQDFRIFDFLTYLIFRN